MKRIIKLSSVLVLFCGVFSSLCCAGTTIKTKEKEGNHEINEQKKNSKNTSNVMNCAHDIPLIPTDVTNQISRNQQNLLRKIFQSDSLPTIKSAALSKSLQCNENSVATVPGQGKIKLVIYPNNKCVVTDTRLFPVKNGKNNVKFLDLVAGDQMSVAICSTKKGQVILEKYHFDVIDDVELLRELNPKSFDLEREKLISRIRGHDAMVKESENVNAKDLRKVKILNTRYYPIVCEADDQYKLVEQYNLYSVSKNDIELCQNFLTTTFASDSTDNIELEISYLTPYIKQKRAYDVCIYDKTNSADVSLKYIIGNFSINDINNACVVIKSGALSENGENVLKIKSPQNDLEFQDVDIKSSDTAVCVDHKKNVARTINYSVKISQDDLDKNFSASKEMANIAVSNLITLTDMWNCASKAKAFAESQINIYYVQGDARNLYSQLKLSDMYKYGNDWKIEIGEADGVSAKYLVIDRNNSVKEQKDYIVKISLKNDRLDDACVCVSFDVDTEKYSVLKSNVDQENDVWNVTLKPAETKELQIKLRIKK